MNVGDKIPEVLGTDHKGNLIKASDYSGRKLVLYTYPRAGTPGCTAEACSLQQRKAQLAELGYAIVGVSRDKADAQQRMADRNGLDFPLIADTDTTLLQALGAWGEKVNYGKRTVGTLRTTYLVDETGTVVKIFTPRDIKTKVHGDQIVDYLTQGH